MEWSEHLKDILTTMNRNVTHLVTGRYRKMNNFLISDPENFILHGYLKIISKKATLVYLKLGVDFLPKNWEFRVFAKQPLSKKLGILRFRQTGHVQKIGTFIIRTGLIRNIFHPKTRSEAHFFVSLHFD